MKIEKVITLVLITAILTWSYTVMSCADKIVEADPNSDTVLLPTRMDIQQGLVDAGYDIGPKGVDGTMGTDTDDAWKQYEIDTFSKRLEQ